MKKSAYKEASLGRWNQGSGKEKIFASLGTLKEMNLNDCLHHSGD